MTDTPATENCADLTMDDAVIRARTARPIVGPAIDTDADYLRSDGHLILDILNNSKTIFNIVAPRRWGKTSFLRRVKRHAEARGRRVILSSFNYGVSCVVSELATFLETEDRPDAVGAAARTLSAHDAERPIVLLDEGAGQINARDECGNALRSLLTQLAAAANDARITLCHAEIPQFFAYCEDQNDDLARPSELVSATPILLRPVEDGVRQAFLDPVVKAGHEELVSEVGSIPGELQSLRCALGDVSDPSDTEDVRKAFRASWSGVLRLVCQNLTANEQAVLWFACQPTRPSLNDLSMGGDVIRDRLESWGFLQPFSNREYAASSTATGGLLLGLLQEPATATRLLVLETHVPLPPSPRPGPTPTFEDGFIIHQISDLHFGKFSTKIAGKWLPEYYLEYLLSQNPDDLPHVIVVCGDVTSVGSAEEFLIASDFFNTIKGTIGTKGPLLRPLYSSGGPEFSKQIVIVPGNHDVQWSQNRDNFTEAIEAFRRFSNGLGCLTPLSDPPAVYLEPVNVTLVACNSAHLGGVDFNTKFLDLSPELIKEGGEVLRKFVDQIRAFLGHIPSIRDLIEAMNVDDLSGGRDSSSKLLDFMFRFTWGYVDPKFLRELSSYVDQARTNNRYSVPDGAHRSLLQPEIKIGVTHHNISTIGEGSLFTDLFNSKELVDAFLKEDINILLHGHQHQFNLTAEKFYGRMSKDSDYMLGKTLHCLGSDSIGVRSPDMPSPTFNEIRILCDNKNKDVRTAEMRRIEYVVHSSGRIERQNKVGHAELMIEGPTVIRDA